MLVAVFSTVSPFNYTKRISSYREELVSLSDVLEEFSSVSCHYIQDGLQGFTFCWIWRDKYSTLPGPSILEQAFKKAKQNSSTPSLVLCTIIEKKY